MNRKENSKRGKGGLSALNLRLEAHDQRLCTTNRSPEVRLNENCAGVATVRKRTTPVVWRNRTSRLLAYRGIAASRSRSNAVRQRRFAHQRAPGSWLSPGLTSRP